jgi:hypothetical protein
MNIDFDAWTVEELQRFSNDIHQLILLKIQAEQTKKEVEDLKKLKEELDLKHTQNQKKFCPGKRKKI